jgi:hypothetical protein
MGDSITSACQLSTEHSRLPRHRADRTTAFSSVPMEHPDQRSLRLCVPSVFVPDASWWLARRLTHIAQGFDVARSTCQQVHPSGLHPVRNVGLQTAKNRKMLARASGTGSRDSPGCASTSISRRVCMRPRWPTTRLIADQGGSPRKPRGSCQCQVSPGFAR